MTVKEKITIAEDVNQLVLFKEGIFYKSYNKHALFFVAHIKPFKVSVNYVKAVKQEVFSIGFPVTAFNTAPKKIKEKNEAIVIKDKIIALGAKIELFENKIVVKNINCVSDIIYNKWCLQQKGLNLLEKQQQLHKKESVQNYEQLKESLLSFKIGSSAPLQAMNFLVELQEKIKTNKIPSLLEG